MPYHATILLLWGAHINLQRVNTACWLYYLLKYAMTSEPYGPIQLDKTNTERLGLQGASNSQLQLISSFIISKPIFHAEATMAYLHIPVIQKNRIVKYIDCNPPILRTKLVTKSRMFGFHPIDAYCNKPIAFESMFFFQYFERFETDRIQKLNMTCYGVDMFGFLSVQDHKGNKFY